MPAFRLSEKAMDDLRSIGRYTQENWGREQRNRYLSMLDAGFHKIAQQPEIGIACDYIRSGYRKHHVGRHLIFYRQSSTHVEIIRILHDRMDLSIHLADS
jgi:toxin ParE1/3/4